ncbi:MAG TPA: ATP-binding protein, partial [Steroidobacteraceae bacterium]
MKAEQQEEKSDHAGLTQANRPPRKPVRLNESAATIVTSNLDLTEWDQAFPANKLLASATLDRMRHNAYCLVLDGKSYRAPRQLPAVIR